MGARLVSTALARWPHVSDRAFRVLMRMALTALDEPSNGTPAGLYFGGRDLLAMTLRSERGGDAQAVYRTVKRALAELVAEGAIERTHAGRAGQNAVYRLSLDAPRSIDQLPVDKPAKAKAQGDTSGPPEGDTSGPPEGDTSGPPEGDTSGSSRGTPADPPRNHEEPVEELYEERKLDLRTDVTDPCAHTTDENPDSDVVDAEPEPGPLRLVAGNPDATATAAPRGIWPALVADDEPKPAPPVQGYGFCVPCHTAGQTVLAADPIAGSRCTYHLRSA